MGTELRALRCATACTPLPAWRRPADDRPRLGGMDRHQVDSAGRPGEGVDASGATEGFCPARLHTGRLQRGTVELSRLGSPIAPALAAHRWAGCDRARAG